MLQHPDSAQFFNKDRFPSNTHSMKQTGSIKPDENNTTMNKYKDTQNQPNRFHNKL